MKKKLSMILAGLALFVGVGFSAMGAGAAAAADPPPEVENELLLRPWLRESIVLASARTIGVSPETVVYALRHGHTLKELGIRHGVGPVELAAGIIAHEKAILHHWVENGRITREQARYGNWFVQTHIRLIINYEFNPD